MTTLARDVIRRSAIHAETCHGGPLRAWARGANGNPWESHDCGVVTIDGRGRHPHMGAMPQASNRHKSVEGERVAHSLETRRRRTRREGCALLGGLAVRVIRAQSKLAPARLPAPQRICANATSCPTRMRWSPACKASTPSCWEAAAERTARDDLHHRHVAELALNNTHAGGKLVDALAKALHIRLVAAHDGLNGRVRIRRKDVESAEVVHEVRASLRRAGTHAPLHALHLVRGPRHILLEAVLQHLRMQRGRFCFEKRAILPFSNFAELGADVSLHRVGLSRQP